MNQYQPHQINLTSRLVEEWIEAGVNVLIQGEYGIGKTTIITKAWEEKIGERNKDWVSFSGATIDPWIDLIGIPRVAPKSKKANTDGKDHIEYILPQSITESLQAIFIDELNRTKPVVLNALMELIQFKSINGRKFPNLRLVWGAINPYDENDENSYHVERLDKAQMDRFHIIVEMPYAPSRKYFATKLGKNKADMILNWWDNQGEANKNVSPRRLEYAIDYISKGGDAKHVLPKNVNTVELSRLLAANSYESQFVKFFNDSNTRMIGSMMNDEHIFENIKSLILGDKQYWPVLEHLPADMLGKIIEEDNSIADWATKCSIPSISSAVQEIIKTNSKFGKNLKSKYDHNFVPVSAKTPAKELALEELLLESIGKNNHQIYTFLIEADNKPYRVTQISITNSLNSMGNKDPLLDMLSTKTDDFLSSMWAFELNNSQDLSHVIGITAAVYEYLFIFVSKSGDKKHREAIYSSRPEHFGTFTKMARIINTCLNYLESNGNTEIADKLLYLISQLPDLSAKEKELFVIKPKKS